MKNEKAASDSENVKAPEPFKKPEHGADSQLHCYNAVSWRLAEMFGEEDEPVVGPSKPNRR